MTLIPLTRGYATRIDDTDTDLADLHWHILMSGSGPYARGKCGRRTILLHRVIMERMLGRPLEAGEEIDHIDGDGLNNERANLRVANRSQNCANKSVYRNNRSGFKGVYWSKHRGCWMAAIYAYGVRYHLGKFDDREQAAEAYITAARHYFGEFAHA